MATVTGYGISIHALRKESDLWDEVELTPRFQFQSTLSVRRATQWLTLPSMRPPISIHALRKESDFRHSGAPRELPISIHALRKESDPADHRQGKQPTISIHALRKESDRSTGNKGIADIDFNPRSP